MAGGDVPLVKGVASKFSPMVDELLKEDSRTTLALTAKGNYHPKAHSIDLKRYFDPAFADLEREKLWKKVWQFACREEDIPNVGDRLAYTVGALSYMIVRVAPDRIKAFHNSCLHRGTRLCDGLSAGETIRCPFHAWEWKLDGSLHNLPARWDFPHVQDDKFRLREVRLGTWGGFVFINPDSSSTETLESNLGVLPAHFASWPPEDHYTISHVRKMVRANWKITMEAFLESYHALEVHQQIMSMLADSSTQYDIWEEGSSHVSRLYSPQGVPSPYFGEEVSPIEAAAATASAFMLPGMAELKIDPASDKSPRAQTAEWRRQMMGAFLKRDFSSWPDAVMLDAIQYWSFPNFGPWYGEGGPIVYQFLPGSNPLETIMSVRLLAPKPGDGAPCPPSAPIVHLGLDDPFSMVPEYGSLFGGLARVFDQDMANIPRVQAGVMAAHESGGELTLGRYQEMRVQYFHEVLDKQLGLK